MRIRLLYFFVLFGIGLFIKPCALAYALENIDIMNRSERGADESRRNYNPPKKETISEYKPSKQSEYQKKFQKAEDYIIKAFKREFKLDTVYKKSQLGKWLKRPISIKKSKSKIIIHHTAQSFSGINNISGEIEVIKQIYKFHTFTRGWGDVGYNYLIGPLGTIYEGRAGGPDAVGAHATWNNTESIGVALLGNFDNEIVTKEQMESLIKLLTALSKKYNIDPKKKVTFHTFDAKSDEPYIHNHKLQSFIGHKDVGDTSCPGKDLYEKLPLIKRTVSKNLGLLD